MTHPLDDPDPRGATAEGQVPAYSVPEAAVLIGIGPLQLWDMVRGNRIRSFKTEGRRLISRRDLEDCIAEREAEASIGA